MYRDGQGVRQNYVQAVVWFDKVATQKHDDTQFYLGLTYDNDQNLVREKTQSYAWFNLGVMYAEGQGVPRDYVNAYAWFNIASTRGVENATKNRNIVLTKIPPGQVKQAVDLSQDYINKYSQ